MLIEIVENALQIAVLLICSFLALYWAIKDQSKTWTLAFFFFFSFGLGDIYWLVCLIFYGVSPQISVVSGLSWYGAYIFLYMLLRRIAPPERPGEKRLLPWIGPVFSAIMAVYFMQWGDILNNLITALLMGLLLFSVISRLTSRTKIKRQRFLFISILVFCSVEYLLWISSCFWEYTPTSPYYWCDILLTLTFPLFLPAIKRAVAHELY